MKAKKQNVKNTMQLHSQAKVSFYKTYLERYLAILCTSPYIKRINIYDVFCGMGIYDDGGKGSPVVAYDTIKKLFESHSFDNKTEITLIINDIVKKRIAKVTDYVNANKHNYCQLVPYSLSIDDLFKTIIPKISQTSIDTRNLIFIDPYGYKEIKKDLLYDLMKNGKTEIILFLPISHMHRFTNAAIQDEEEIVQYEPLRNFVYSFFPDVNHPIRQNTINVKDYIRYVSNSLKYNDKFYTTSYFIERDKSNFFALFFMSSHILGFEKILEVKWSLDEETGSGFKLPDKNGNLFEEQFAEEAKHENAQKLKTILLEALKTPKTNGQIYELVLKNEFLPKHANEVLRELQNENNKFKVLDLYTNKPIRKGSFYISYNPKTNVKMYLEQ